MVETQKTGDRFLYLVWLLVLYLARRCVGSLGDMRFDALSSPSDCCMVIRDPFSSGMFGLGLVSKSERVK